MLILCFLLIMPIELIIDRKESRFKFFTSVDLLRLDVVRVRRLESLITVKGKLFARTRDLLKVLFYLVIDGIYNLVLCTRLLLVITLLCTSIQVFLDCLSDLFQVPILLRRARPLFFLLVLLLRFLVIDLFFSILICFFLLWRLVLLLGSSCIPSRHTLNLVGVPNH